jgi:hypothetical protein
MKINISVLCNNDAKSRYQKIGKRKEIAPAATLGLTSALLLDYNLRLILSLLSSFLFSLSYI